MICISLGIFKEEVSVGEEKVGHQAFLPVADELSER